MSTVLKLQRSVGGEPAILGYNQSRSVLFQVTPRPDLLKWFGTAHKVFVRARVVRRSTGVDVTVINSVRDPGW